MRAETILLDVAGGIFVVLGSLHALYTFLDIESPRRLVPDDPSVADAMARTSLHLTRGRTTMWRAWVGFNFSHSVGVVLFGALCIAAGSVLGPVAIPGWVLLGFVAIGLIYLWVALLYWFRTPVAGIAIATACLLGAWLTYVIASSN
jgi:hypothetical protein